MFILHAQTCTNNVQVNQTCLESFVRYSGVGGCHIIKSLNIINNG